MTSAMDVKGKNTTPQKPNKKRAAKFGGNKKNTRQTENKQRERRERG